MSEESLIFHDLIENKLSIDATSFEDFERFEALERLINAANAMQGKVGDFTGINICIHVASSFVLLGCKDSNKYHAMEDLLKAKFKEVDPSVILASAALYYILRKTIGKLKGNKYQDIEDQYVSYLKEKVKKEGGKFSKNDEHRAHNDIKGAIYQLEYINERFDRMNWMIGVDVMKTLGIPQARSKKMWVFQEQPPTGEKNWVLKTVIDDVKNLS